MTLNIVNVGFSNSLAITSVTLIGADTNQFKILSDSGQSVIGPAGSRILTMNFDPGSLGAKSALLRILSNDTNEPVVDVALQGNGTDFNPCTVFDPAAAQAQNLITDAQLVRPGIIYTGTTVGATRDGTATCGNSTNSPDVWYRYVAASNGVVIVSLAGSSFSAVLSAHTNNSGGTNIQIACNQDIRGLPPQISFNALSGVEIFLRIAGR